MTTHEKIRQAKMELNKATSEYRKRDLLKYIRRLKKELRKYN